MSNRHDDWLRDAVIARVAAMRITAYRIALETGHAVSEQHIVNYLAGRSSMGSAKLQHVLRVLGLELRPIRRKNGPPHVVPSKP